MARIDELRDAIDRYGKESMKAHRQFRQLADDILNGLATYLNPEKRLVLGLGGRLKTGHVSTGQNRPWGCARDGVPLALRAGLLQG